MSKHEHNHQHSHEHGHNHDMTGIPQKKLIIALCLTMTFMIIEFTGGLFTNSLALISDAMHMLTDSFGLLLAIMAISLGKKAADKIRTYGYERFEILAAIINSLVLFVIAFYILYEAFARIFVDKEVHTSGMLVISVIGLLVNFFSMLILHSEKDNSLNVKGAYLEVWADMLGSMGVIIGAIIIKFTGYQLVDSIIAVFIGFMVFPRAYSLLKEGLNIVLQGVPHGIVYDEIKELINSEEGVKSCHDLHVWSITQNKAIMTGHVVYNETADPDEIRLSIEKKLLDKFELKHTTLQMERGEETDHHHVCEIK